MELAAFFTSVLRYVMLAIILFVSVRVIVAMFAKKVTNPVRGKLTGVVARGSVNLYDRETSVGRNKNCDVVLPFETVSRLHAVIAYRNRGFVVFDTFSRSGVTVNGEKIKKKAVIKDGDTVGFGGVDYVLSEAKYRYIKDKSGRAGSPLYGLLLVLISVFNLCSMLLDMFPQGEVSWSVAASFLGFIALMWAYFIFASLVMRITDFELEILAFMFSSLGLAVVGSIYPDKVFKQFLAVALGVVCFCILLAMLRYLDTVKILRWPIAFGAIGLLAVTLVFAEPQNGALSWLSFGGFSIQPSELVKAAFIFVGAVTLEKLQSIRHLTMYIIFAAACVGELFLMYDFGAALIFFFTFIVIAFMRSGDWRTLLLICVAAAIGAAIIIFFKPYVANRFSTYLRVWEFMDEGGYQQTRTLIYSASGGLFGLGLGNGMLRYIFASAEDLVFGVVCEEFGIIAGFAVPLTYAAVTVMAVINAKNARSSYYAVASVAAAAMMLFQTMLSIFGITDILPLTGVTLPFVSKGGSSVISCFLLLAFIKSADVRTYANFKPKLERGEKNENHR